MITPHLADILIHITEHEMEFSNLRRILKATYSNLHLCCKILIELHLVESWTRKINGRKGNITRWVRISAKGMRVKKLLQQIEYELKT